MMNPYKRESLEVSEERLALLKIARIHLGGSWEKPLLIPFMEPVTWKLITAPKVSVGQRECW